MSRARQGWLLLLLSAVLVSVVWGPPPEPYGLSGFVFDRDGLTQMPVGTAVSVNDTNSTSYVNTTTGNAPQSGYYSVVVNGSINDTIIVRAMYNDKMVALLMEWDDRTKSIPGDESAEKIADEPIAEDGVAVQLPVVIPTEMRKPYFGMGDESHPVNIWHWKSGTKSEPEAANLLNSLGFKAIEKRDAAAVGLKTVSSYSDGTWKVLMYRPLTTQAADKDIQFAEGKFIPVAFAAWDGSNNSEKGSKHTMTTWYWLLLKPAPGSRPLVAALAIMVLFAGGLLWWARSAGRAAGRQH